ncbi:putative addiction module component, TIGR02574 family [Salegentibacter holothuriorum]|uniref:Putative addiction module component, TIGR02574 family n=1 Tax=Salegentibacter holothuriorum TaxID=241145 RepID=A0A1T5C013_9FLAO|nr:addiction module protein [Salegentibacter holothuriorum]SKB52715.1 putative addiction module component, TIGR02574 family [Salegentibacter holothuriorum]
MQKIIACDDEDLLKEMEIFLQEVKVSVHEPNEAYKVDGQKSLLSNEQLEEIERRWKAYKSGEEKAIPWEDARKEIQDKYGF